MTFMPDPHYGTGRVPLGLPGRQYAVLSERSKIKRRTMELRKKEYLAQKAA